MSVDTGWRTINGAKVYLRKGESATEAISRKKQENEAAEKEGVLRCESEADGCKFKSFLMVAKESQPPEKAWRVDTDSHEGKDYVGKRTYVSDGGSTFSVTADGDIISVCKKADDVMMGHELLEKAVKVGGCKLDSFSGNFAYYLRNGFEPVSWTAFDETYKPSGWIKERDRPEPVIFFKYTGKKISKQPKDFWELKEAEFYRKVKMSKNYDEAKAKRDEEV